MSEVPGADPKPDPWVKRFVDHLEFERAASGYTRRNYAHALAEFGRYYQQARNSAPNWAELQRDDLRQYLRYLGREQLGQSAIRLRFSALRSFYKFLIRQGEVAVSPIRNISLPKNKKRLPRFLTVEQMRTLLEAPPRRAETSKGKA